MNVAGTSFYVQKPVDQYWNTGMANWVVEAAPIDNADSSLSSWQKTDEYVRSHLKVINPKTFSWPIIDKGFWVECAGPVRKLERNDYMQLVHSIMPQRPLPTDWVVEGSTIVYKPKKKEGATLLVFEL